MIDALTLQLRSSCTQILQSSETCILILLFFLGLDCNSTFSSHRWTTSPTLPSDRLSSFLLLLLKRKKEKTNQQKSWTSSVGCSCASKPQTENTPDPPKPRRCCSHNQSLSLFTQRLCFKSVVARFRNWKSKFEWKAPKLVSTEKRDCANFAVVTQKCCISKMPTSQKEKNPCELSMELKCILIQFWSISTGHVSTHTV